MAIHEVIRMGHPTLRKVAEQVSLEEIQSEEMSVFIQDMIETMEDYDGIGLAAPQINVSKQIAVIKIHEDSPRYPESNTSPLFVLFNPIVSKLTDEEQGFWEGCLSVPGLRGFVERPSKIQVDYIDQEGKSQSLVLEGFLATVFQHELDHLQGTLYIDRIKDTKLLSYSEEFDEYFDQDS